MEIIIREYDVGDSEQVVDVFRDSNNSLRQSRGGAHPDEEVDRMVGQPDEEILKLLTYGSILFVAQVDGTDTIAGMGAITARTMDRILKTTYSRSHYVRESFQHGKAGVSVGSLLRKATIAKASELGCRKMYGFSTPEAKGFHKKFGARFFSSHNTRYLNNKVEVNYYEIELRKSLLNPLRVEPYLFKLGKIWKAFLMMCAGSRI